MLGLLGPGGRVVLFTAALLAYGAHGNLSEYLDDLKTNMEKIAEHVENVCCRRFRGCLNSHARSIFYVKHSNKLKGCMNSPMHPEGEKR